MAIHGESRKFELNLNSRESWFFPAQIPFQGKEVHCDCDWRCGSSSLPCASLPSWSRSRVFSEKPAAFQFTSIWSASPTTPFKGCLWLVEKSPHDHRRSMSVSCIIQEQRLFAKGRSELMFIILVEGLDRFRWTYMRQYFLVDCIIYHLRDP